MALLPSSRGAINWLALWPLWNVLALSYSGTFVVSLSSTNNNPIALDSHHEPDEYLDFEPQLHIKQPHQPHPPPNMSLHCQYRPCSHHPVPPVSGPTHCIPTAWLECQSQRGNWDLQADTSRTSTSELNSSYPVDENWDLSLRECSHSPVA